jgi:hypothetical protein
MAVVMPEYLWLVVVRAARALMPGPRRRHSCVAFGAHPPKAHRFLLNARAAASLRAAPSQLGSIGAFIFGFGTGALRAGRETSECGGCCCARRRTESRRRLWAAAARARQPRILPCVR